MGCSTLQHFSVVGEASVVAVGSLEEGPPEGVSSSVTEYKKSHMDLICLRLMQVC